MALSERFGWMLLGMAIGFVLGLIVARLRAIEEKVDTVDEHVKKPRDEWGFMRIPVVADVLYILALLVVLWGAYAAHQASNEVEDTQGELKHTVGCIEQYNTRQGEALSGRDASVKAGTRSEIELWTKYAKLYAQAKSDPTKIPQLQEALNRAILSHRQALIETQDTRDDHPYPPPNVLQDCKENKK